MRSDSLLTVLDMTWALQSQIRQYWERSYKAVNVFCGAGHGLALVLWMTAAIDFAAGNAVQLSARDMILIGLHLVAQ